MFRSLPLVLVVCLVGCKSSVEKRYAEAVCEKNFECCDATDIPPDTTEGECREGLEMGIAAMVSEAEEDDAAGRVDYSEDNLEKCLEAIEKAGCGEWPAVANASPCDAIIVAKVADGGSCEGDDECISGSCFGTCEATAAQGADCSTLSCGRNLYCDSSQVCQPKKAAGQPCTTFDECLSDDCVIAAGASESTCVEACYQGCRSVEATPVVLAAAGVLLLIGRRRR